MPKATIFLIFFLAFIGICLFIIGFIDDVRAWDPSKGIAFWVLGILVSLPGFYYVVKLWQAFRAGPGLERQQIIDEIPK